MAMNVARGLGRCFLACSLVSWGAGCGSAATDSTTGADVAGVDASAMMDTGSAADTVATADAVSTTDTSGSSADAGAAADAPTSDTAPTPDVAQPDDAGAANDSAVEADAAPPGDTTQATDAGAADTGSAGDAATGGSSCGELTIAIGKELQSVAACTVDADCTVLQTGLCPFAGMPCGGVAVNKSKSLEALQALLTAAAVPCNVVTCKCMAPPAAFCQQGQCIAP
jgi:hypothetical protein